MYFNGYESGRQIALSISAIVGDVSQVRNLRKAIFGCRDRLRGTDVFGEVFHALIGDDYTHPPVNIEGTQDGCFRAAQWEPARRNYEPVMREQYVNPEINYPVGCAVYLLIQEIYPNVYYFPSNTISNLEGGATIKLNMKRKFIGQALTPKNPPQYIPQAPQQPVRQNMQPKAPQPGMQQAPRQNMQPKAPQPEMRQTPVQQNTAPEAQSAPKFCVNCGAKLKPGARFCAVCGSKI